MQIAEDFNGIIVTGNDAVALRWNNNPKTSNKEEVACAIFQWFKDNEMKANADKCHVLLSTSNELTIKINEIQIKNSQSEKLLGINIGNDLKFEDHINNICGKASAKISALSRIAPYMNLPKRKQIMNASLNHNLVTAL